MIPSQVAFPTWYVLGERIASGMMAISGLTAKGSQEDNLSVEVIDTQYDCKYAPHCTARSPV